jgi:hypothetical protein
MKPSTNSRRDRLAAALRENLKRRKAQARATSKPDDKAAPRPTAAKKGA